MSKRESPLQPEMIRGALDKQILRILACGPADGQISAFWCTTENNRKAKHYGLTTPARKNKHAKQWSRWDQLAPAKGRRMKRLQEAGR